jgi:hypothetical protein
MKLLITTLLLTLSLVAESISIVAEKSFVPFLKKIEQTQKLPFMIDEKNTSLEAFEKIKKNAKPMFAIVRGDILADNLEAKNFFKDTAYQNFKVITRLDSQPTYLYFITKRHIKSDAYDALTPNRQTQKIKKISIGYLRDLSFIYLDHIAKTINAAYRFHYRSFEPEESLQKLDVGTIDGCFMFVSKDMKNQIERLGFSLSKLKKPVNIDATKFAEVFSDKKTFHELHNGIQVDNYLIASSSINETHLYPLVYALNESNALKTVDSKFGIPDERVSKVSAEIEQDQKNRQSKLEEQLKACSEAKESGMGLSFRYGTFEAYNKAIKAKFQAISKEVDNVIELFPFKPELDNLNFSYKLTNQETSKIIKNLKDKISDCNVKQVDTNLALIDVKLENIKNIKSSLAQLESRILHKRQLDSEQLLVEQKQKEQELERENRIFQQQMELEEKRYQAILEKEIRAKEEEAKQGILGFVKKVFE